MQPNIILLYWYLVKSVYTAETNRTVEDPQYNLIF